MINTLIIVLKKTICFLASHQLLVVTVATEETDGYKRFRHSLDLFGYDVLVSLFDAYKAAKKN